MSTVALTLETGLTGGPSPLFEHHFGASAHAKKSGFERETLMSTPDWVTIADAATRLDVHTATVRRAIARGELVARRFGPRLIRVSAASIASYGRSLAPASAAS